MGIPILKKEETMNELCPNCGSKMMQYKHSLNKQLVDIVTKLYYKPGKLSDLNITHVQINNAQKLRYWGLIEQIIGETDEWRVSWAGELFIRGKLHMRKTAITFHGKVTGHEGDAVTFQQLKPDNWITRPEYAETAIPKTEGGLFR
jgi:hypothetical protein